MHPSQSTAVTRGLAADTRTVGRQLRVDEPRRILGIDHVAGHGACTVSLEIHDPIVRKHLVSESRLSHTMDRSVEIIGGSRLVELPFLPLLLGLHPELPILVRDRVCGYFHVGHYPVEDALGLAARLRGWSSMGPHTT